MNNYQFKLIREDHFFFVDEEMLIFNEPKEFDIDNISRRGLESLYRGLIFELLEGSAGAFDAIKAIVDPVHTGGGGTGTQGPKGDRGSLWYTGTNPPASNIGSNDDMYLQSNGDYWKKTLGTWQNLGSIKGSQGSQGLQGPPGKDGVPYYTHYAPSGLFVGGGRIVSVVNGLIAYSDASIANTSETVIGVTLNAALPGEELKVQYLGDCEDSAWNWIPGKPIFVGLNGVMTQTIPVFPLKYLLQVAVALTATKIAVQIKQPIDLI